MLNFLNCSFKSLIIPLGISVLLGSFFSQSLSQVLPDTIKIPLDTIVVIPDSVEINVRAIAQDSIKKAEIKDLGKLKILKEDTIKYWERGGDWSLNLSQIGLTNWAGGGKSSISLASKLNLFANYNKNLNNWENRAEIAYGLVRQGGKGNIFKKTDDKILLFSKYNRKINKAISGTAIIDFRSQIDKGFRFEKIPNSEDERRIRISQFMAPGYLQASIGLSHMRKNFYSLTLSPFTGKFTFVLDSILASTGSFGVDKGETFRKEAGSSFNASIEKEIMKNIKLKSFATLFAGFERFGNIDVNWEGSLLMKVNKYITSTISAQTLYDDDINIVRENKGETKGDKGGPALQVKNVINVGFLVDL